MKTITTMLCILVLMAFNSMLHAQNSEVKVKVVKDINGVKTVMDTTITSDGTVDVEAILQEMGIDADVEHPGDDEYHKMVIEIDKESSEVEGMDDKKMIFIHKDGHTTDISGEGGEVNTFEWNTDDGKEMTIEDLDEETQKHLEEAGIDLQEFIKSHRGGNGMVKMRVIKTGEGKDDEIMVNVENGGEKGARIMEKGEKENVTKEMTKDVDVEVNEWVDKEGNKKVTQVVKVAIFMRDLEDADKVLLKRSGVEVGSLENSLKVEQLSFYPNPNNGRFNLSFDAAEEGDVQINIVNAEGKRVYEENLPAFSGKYQKEIDLTGNASGVYFLNLSQNGRVLNKKLVVE